MAKLTDLKALVDAARGNGAASSASAPAPPKRPARRARGRSRGHETIALPDATSPPRSTPTATSTSRTRSPTSRACRRATAPPPRDPAPRRSRALRMEDERDALEMSKYGVEPSPHSWDIGQELEARADVPAARARHRHPRQAATRALGGPERARSARDEHRRGARRARRFPARSAQPAVCAACASFTARD